MLTRIGFPPSVSVHLIQVVIVALPAQRALLAVISGVASDRRQAPEFANRPSRLESNRLAGRGASC
jgi:hypothetical protein